MGRSDVARWIGHVLRRSYAGLFWQGPPDTQCIVWIFGIVTNLDVDDVTRRNGSARDDLVRIDEENDVVDVDLVSRRCRFEYEFEFLSLDYDCRVVCLFCAANDEGRVSENGGGGGGGGRNKGEFNDDQNEYEYC
mmetsp:Transcript_78815/g.118479  ORF Transcript_78815/g.118479 Transcript_78815/m.118479 type:complete len:135 (-) Transcript_78815:321-725(-)